VAYWIFQANPKIYRLAEALCDLDRIAWRVNQHTSEIHTGDEVLLWQAGPQAGIYALAVVESEPEKFTDDDPYWRDPSLHRTPKLGTWLRITCRFLDRPVLRSDLLKDPALGNLSILKFTQGTNFPVSPEEWGHVMELLGIQPRPPLPAEAGEPLDVRETHLRSALAKNLALIEAGLSAYFEERLEEYPVPHGRIDLLCRDVDDVPVVVELKGDQWDVDKAVGQIARYMGWAKRTLAGGGRVRGILVVSGETASDPKLADVKEALPGLDVRSYRITFEMH
jgi:predicted RNA-binding protein with PUA-like domain